MTALVSKVTRWVVPFYASSGRKYRLTMHALEHAVVSDGNTEAIERVPRPISLLERDAGDKVHALYADMTREVFESIAAVAQRYDSIVFAFESQDLD